MPTFPGEEQEVVVVGLHVLEVVASLGGGEDPLKRLALGELLLTVDQHTNVTWCEIRQNVIRGAFFIRIFVDPSKKVRKMSTMTIFE